ncbi:SIMPL domain-containing protein [Natronolimnohabitans sp. A-GB9]|uniref:SIMPL domain-containing protein n=1 Tax=Natronolimnohabitans sp. A-GB9 TaxID=3069757 RepID=UPI0027B3BD9D|nr:SIMPL domain-containing protein [Natronolimnohabitans sp. A-GB9]MDQ2049943.1 SIMPL domain-containing protein [Natronolimnohabitans sp. A-GB9]
MDFGLTDETRAELRDQALEEALANADDEARYIAENRNVTITGTKSVSTRNVDVVAATADRSYMTEADDDAAAGPSTDIDSGPARVTASVDAVYGFENTD